MMSQRFKNVKTTSLSCQTGFARHFGQMFFAPYKGDKRDPKSLFFSFHHEFSRCEQQRLLQVIQVRGGPPQCGGHHPPSTCRHQGGRPLVGNIIKIKRATRRSPSVYKAGGLPGTAGDRRGRRKHGGRHVDPISATTTTTAGTLSSVDCTATTDWQRDEGGGGNTPTPLRLEDVSEDATLLRQVGVPTFTSTAPAAKTSPRRLEGGASDPFGDRTKETEKLKGGEAAE